MTIVKFTDLAVWEEAHKLTLLVYKCTNKFPKTEEFGLKNQIRRAAVSVESCIAEGFSRYHYKERLNFYYNSRGSLAEVQSQAITSFDLKYINKSEYESITKLSDNTGIILNGLIKSTEKLANKST